VSCKDCPAPRQCGIFGCKKLMGDMAASFATIPEPIHVVARPAAAPPVKKEPPTMPDAAVRQEPLLNLTPEMRVDTTGQQRPARRPPQRLLIVREVRGGFIAVPFDDGEPGPETVAAGGDGLAELARNWGAGGG
jgi:hypothetical protein